MRAAIYLAATIVLSTPVLAQKDLGQQKEWVAMFARIDDVILPYEKRLGLSHGYDTYCRQRVNVEMDAHPKDGSIPLGVTDWRVLDRETFMSDLQALEEYQTAALILCLAQVRGTLNAAEANRR